jgi:hypothetical protein
VTKLFDTHDGVNSFRPHLMPFRTQSLVRLIESHLAHCLTHQVPHLLPLNVFGLLLLIGYVLQLAMITFYMLCEVFGLPINGRLFSNATTDIIHLLKGKL